MKQLILDLTKNKIDIDISEDSEIIGIFIGKGKSTIKTKICLTVSAPSLKLRFVIKSILQDDSTAEINCLMNNPKGIKYTNGHMDIGFILASDKSKAIITPGLEIKENDISFSHSMTVGKPDQIQIQYLISRGLTSQEALSLIIKGYVKDIINRIKDDTIRTYYIKQLNNV